MQVKKKEIVETDSQEFHLIHGELTPPHIFILNNGDVGLIDIEGIKYFDREYDLAVIHFMYGDQIPIPTNINESKMEFYTLCLKIGYVSAASDYHAHIDGDNQYFYNIRQSNLRDLSEMV